MYRDWPSSLMTPTFTDPDCLRDVSSQSLNSTADQSKISAGYRFADVDENLGNLGKAETKPHDQSSTRLSSVRVRFTLQTIPAIPSLTRADARDVPEGTPGSHLRSEPLDRLVHLRGGV